MKTTLLNYVLYQTGWLCCVLGAAYGYAGPGAVAALALVAIHLLLTDRRRLELRMLFVAGALGLAADSLQVAAGLLRFDTGQRVSWLAPPWIVIMWLQFATTFRYSMRWLVGRPVLAICLGLVGGPLAYGAGYRMGAVQFAEPPYVSLLVLALIWSAALPLLLRMAEADPEGRYRGLVAEQSPALLP